MDLPKVEGTLNIRQELYQIDEALERGDYTLEEFFIQLFMKYPNGVLGGTDVSNPVIKFAMYVLERVEKAVSLNRYKWANRDRFGEAVSIGDIVEACEVGKTGRVKYLGSNECIIRDFDSGENLTLEMDKVERIQPPTNGSLVGELEKIMGKCSEMSEMERHSAASDLIHEAIRVGADNGTYVLFPKLTNYQMSFLPGKGRVADEL